MRKKEVNYYFKTFNELFKYTMDASHYLEQLVLKFDNRITEEQLNEMHAIEHKADLCLHDALAKLAKEFITPIENEDILAIIKQIDDSTDTLEELVIKMYIHDITKLPKCAVKFVDIIRREAEAMAIALVEFPNFKKSSLVHDKIMEVLSVEEEGDKLYISSIKELYQTVDNVKELYVMEDLINTFEDCCDVIEKIAQVVDEAVMKNA